MKKKIYIIRHDCMESGCRTFRFNRGFNAFELLGILEQTQLDIIKQLAGEIKVDETKRVLIEEVAGGQQ